MSKETFIGGDYLEFTGGNNLNYGKEGIENIGSKVIQVGVENGVIYGVNGKAPTISNNNFKYKWTSDKEGNKEITQAELYDIVYFHLELPNDLKDTKVTLKLYNNNGALSDDDMDVYKTIELQGGKGYAELDLVAILQIINAEENKTLEKWRAIIESEYGDEIELYWKLEYSKGLEALDNKILNVFIDNYCIAILRNKYRYTCNAGWIDKSHAFETTERDYVGADNLWKQLVNETGIKSRWRNAFQVIYKQDAKKFGVKAGITKKYMIAYGLSLEIKKRIAMTIFQEVSMEFEEFQGTATLGFGDSNFEPADLVSNLLGLYKVLRKEKKETILSRCNELNARKSLKVYRKYPGTFSKSEYKNRKFTPRYFPNDSCSGGVFPKEYQEIEPYPKTNENIFRDWIDLFDFYKGIPPIIGPN